MTSLDRIKSEWEFLAQQDALFSILTDESKIGGKWEIEEFMTTGEKEIETVMGHLAQLNVCIEYGGKALDFGCGVGRLTQPLAQRFDSCVGVDISEKMIQIAESFNRQANCDYICSSDVRLPFEDESFSFIYTNIVLQHMPHSLADGYLRQFVRILQPGGVAVFGVQDSYAISNISSFVARARQVLHLRSRIKAILKIDSADMEMHCLPEDAVRRAVFPAKIVSTQFTNSAAKDFNGSLAYLDQTPCSGYIGKQYCVVKP
jgi:SAM-dependent methyltransferase